MRTWTDANRISRRTASLEPVGAGSQSDGRRFLWTIRTCNSARRIDQRYRSDASYGLGVRPSDWSLGVLCNSRSSRAFQLRLPTSRRSFYGFTVMTTLSSRPPTMASYGVTARGSAPTRLVAGSDFQSLRRTPNKADSQQFRDDSRPYGDWYQHFNGVDVTINARMRSGLTVQGGTSTGQNAGDNCAVARICVIDWGIGAWASGGSTSVQPVPIVHVDYGMLTQLRGVASYIVPKVGVQRARCFRASLGALLVRTMQCRAATVAQSLGRPPSGMSQRELSSPHAWLDVRRSPHAVGSPLAKILEIGRSRTMSALTL